MHRSWAGGWSQLPLYCWLQGAQGDVCSEGSHPALGVHEGCGLPGNKCQQLWKACPFLVECEQDMCLQNSVLSHICGGIQVRRLWAPDSPNCHLSNALTRFAPPPQHRNAHGSAGWASCLLVTAGPGNCHTAHTPCQHLPKTCSMWAGIATTPSCCTSEPPESLPVAWPPDPLCRLAIP